jgi:GNAT superfamily N-acetyltransferase
VSAGVAIRPATRADADVLREIRLLALADEPDAFGSTYEEARRYGARQWEQMAAEWNYYLALDGDQPVGMASGGRFASWPQARWLYSMFVTPPSRGTGVAVDLVRAVAGWARRDGSTTLGLHVTSRVTRAVAFYTKLGFAPVGEPAPMERDASLLLVTMTTDLASNERI